VAECDVQLSDGRTLHVYDIGSPGDGRFPVVYHHGTPNIGAPPAPLFPAADRLGLRWVSYDRPAYGGSTPHPGRDVASAAPDAAAVADALGLARFAVLGHSGGGPHALACAALLPERVVAAVSISGMAPFGADGLDFFAGMADGAAASLRAAVAGRAVRERLAATADDAETEGQIDIGFTPGDWEALSGDWSWLLDVVGRAQAGGPAGEIDDDLAYVAPWGFEPASIACPVLLLHGARDRMVPSSHSAWLAEHCPAVELRVTPDNGHISVLTHAEAALDWLAQRAA
jgi:pimeloyl-ACP methyl ester carboxylesterase